MTYVIRLQGFIQGGFKAEGEDAAFQKYAVSEGYTDFKDLLQKRSLKRDDFKIEEVPEGK